MLLTLIQSPEGAPNSCFGLYDEQGECRQFVQSDWDYAGISSSLGWVPCKCGETDGTVNCKHRTVSQMLSDAWEFLAERDGESFDLEDY